MEILNGITSLVRDTTVQIDDLIQKFNEDVFETVDSQASIAGFENIDIPDTTISSETYEYVKALLASKDHAKAIFIDADSTIKYAEVESFKLTPQRVLYAQNLLKAIPALDRLRFQLCPSVFSDKRFWFIYFSTVEPMTRLRVERKGSKEKQISLSCSKKLSRNSATLLSKTLENSEEHPFSLTTEINTHVNEEITPRLSSILMSGAKHTLRMAESFIEAVDEHAGIAMAPEISLESSAKQCIGKTNIPSGKGCCQNKSCETEFHEDCTNNSLQDEDEVLIAEDDEWALIIVEKNMASSKDTHKPGENLKGFQFL